MAQPANPRPATVAPSDAAIAIAVLPRLDAIRYRLVAAATQMRPEQLALQLLAQLLPQLRILLHRLADLPEAFGL